MTIPVTITKFSEEILVGIPHTKCATKWAEKRMPKQDKEVGRFRHNFAPQQAGNPPWCPSSKRQKKTQVYEFFPKISMKEIFLSNALLIRQFIAYPHTCLFILINFLPFYNL